jgi:hypothetical protein
MSEPEGVLVGAEFVAATEKEGLSEAEIDLCAEDEVTTEIVCVPRESLDVDGDGVPVAVPTSEGITVGKAVVVAMEDEAGESLLEPDAEKDADCDALEVIEGDWEVERLRETVTEVVDDTVYVEIPLVGKGLRDFEADTDRVLLALPLPEACWENVAQEDSDVEARGEKDSEGVGDSDADTPALGETERDDVGVWDTLGLGE